jgi:transposase InsO family protein
VIEKLEKGLSIRQQCHLLGIARSSYYRYKCQTKSRRDAENQVLAGQIWQVWDDGRRVYGYRRIHAQLKQNGILVGKERIRKLMKVANIVCLRKKRTGIRTTRPDGAPVHANHLNQEFVAEYPDQKWVSDITYIATQEGFLYLAGVEDLFSRKIVGLSMDDHMETTLVKTALDMAIYERDAQALLVHSDRGSQYTSHAYQQRLAEIQALVSMSGTGNCYDNAPMESFWATLKAECAQKIYATREQARTDIFNYVFAFYNRTRLHSALGYMSPEQFELQFRRLPTGLIN